MGLNVIYHVLRGLLALIALMNVIATMMPLVTLWMEDVNANLDLQGPDVRNTVPKDIGAKTVIERANAKMPIMYVTLYRDAYVDLDFMDQTVIFLYH